MTRAELHRDVVHELTMFNRKLKSQFDTAVSFKGMTLARARLLYCVIEADGMTQSELANALDIETPTLVRLLDSMQQQGLIERRPCQSDRRIKKISLTKEGLSAATEMKSFVLEFRRQMMIDLSDRDLQQLLALAQRLNAGLLAVGRGKGDNEQ